MLQDGGLKVSTAERYKLKWDYFKTWERDIGSVILGGKNLSEIDNDFLLCLLAWEWKFSTWSQTKKLVAAIKHNFTLTYGFDPFIEDRHMRKTHKQILIRALRKLRLDSAAERRVKLAVTKAILLKTRKHVNMDDFNEQAAWAVAVLGTDCLLRWSEVCEVSKNDKKLLRTRDWIQQSKTMFALRLHDTKTMMHGDSMLVTCVKNNTGLCSPTEVAKHIKNKEKKFGKGKFKLSDPLFVTEKGIPMSSKVAQRILKVFLKRAGYDESLWQFGLSLRRGGATTMAASGVPDRVIRAMGRWKSGAYRLYIDLQQQEKEMWAGVVNRLLRSKEEGDWVLKERLSEIIDGPEFQAEVEEYEFTMWPERGA